MKSTKRQKIINIVLCFAMIFTALGFVSSNKGLYLSAICDALNIKRTVYSLTSSFRFITTSIVNIFFGALVAKFGTKKLIITGFVLLISSVLLQSIAGNVYVFYGSQVLAGMGFSFTGTGMVGSVVNRWSPENKGTVMGVILCANGTGGALAAQIVTPLISSGTFGYRNAFRLVAVILSVLMLIILIFFREKPKGDTGPVIAPAKKKRGQRWVGIPFAEAVRKPCFYFALLGIFLTGFCLQGISGISQAHMKDVGLSPAYVATVSSVSMLVLTGSKFLTGILYDKAGLRITITISCICAILAMISLAMVSVENSALAIIYAVICSIAMPLETVMLPLYAADLFGDHSFDKIMGIFISVNTAGYALGSPTVNLGFDLTGSYRGILFITAGIMVGVTVCMHLVITAAHKLRKAVTEGGN